MTKLTTRLTVVIGLAIAGACQPVCASMVFDINQQTTGFVDGLSGASEFGLTDGTPGGSVCPLCDSVVNFATYANPTMADWATALGVNPIGVGQTSPGMTPGVDTNAKWVFFYQIQNTNPLGGTNAVLENFNVTKGSTTGDPIDVQPYNSAGYIDGWGIAPFSATPGLDAPNDWVPALTEAKDITLGRGEIAPTTAFGTLLSGPSPIASVSVRAGQVAYAGALFQFDPGMEGVIPPDAYSDLLILTSNDRYAGIVWAETESPGGFGAAGDVAGIKNVAIPEASSIAIWSLLGLAGFGFGRFRN